MNENARRLLALGASVALVGVALFLRGRDDDGGGGGGGDGERTLICPRELQSACEEAAGDDFEVRVEEALATADALSDPETSATVDGDVWLVPRPWVEAVTVARERAGQAPVLGSPSGVIARSPVVLVVATSRADALTTACGVTISWTCVGDVADGPWTAAGGRPEWGPVKAGVARPDGAGGLTVLGAAAADFLGDPGFASNDFGGPLDNWLSKLAASSGTASNGLDPVADMITQGPGFLAVLGTLEASAGRAFENDALRVVVPEPVVTADLVAVPIIGPGDDPDDDDILDDLVDNGLRDWLAMYGWRVHERSLNPGLNPDLALPDEPGVPRGDVLWALLQRWMDLV